MCGATERKDSNLKMVSVLCLCIDKSRSVHRLFSFSPPFSRAHVFAEILVGQNCWCSLIYHSFYATLPLIQLKLQRTKERVQREQSEKVKRHTQRSGFSKLY